MERTSFFDFTVEGDNLDPVAMREAIGLPCEIFYKGQIVEIKTSGREIKSRSTRWVYSANTDNNAKTEPFLEKHLEVISKKMSELKSYIKNYKAILEITIYEDDAKDEYLFLTKKIIRLLSKIDLKVCIAFKNLEAIYGFSLDPADGRQADQHLHEEGKEYG